MIDKYIYTYPENIVKVKTVIMTIKGPKGRCILFKGGNVSSQSEAIRAFMKFNKGGSR